MKAILVLCLVFCTVDSIFGAVQQCQNFKVGASDGNAEVSLSIAYNNARNGNCDIAPTGGIVATTSVSLSRRGINFSSRFGAPCSNDWCCIFCKEVGGRECSCAA